MCHLLKNRKPSLPRLVAVAAWNKVMNLDRFDLVA
jgi:hypothetical protein